MAREGLLRSAVQSELPIEEWMHQLPNSLAKPEPFLDRLGKPFDSNQIRTIAEKIRPHAPFITPLLLDSWKSNEGNIVKQAPIACLIGMIDPISIERLQLSDSIVDWLLRSEIAQDHKGCGKILKLLKQQVTPSLVRLYASSRSDEERASAFHHLGSLLDESNVEVAIDGLSAARPEEFDAWRGELTQYHRKATRVIRERLRLMGNSFKDDEEGEDQARICSNLLMMEFGFGKTDLLWPALSAPVDPRPRVYFAHQIGLTGFDLAPLFERLQTETDSKVAYSLLLAFSQTNAEKIDPETLEGLKQWVSSSYRTHPAAGVHSMCRYLLRQWGRDNEVSQADQSLITNTPVHDREWYVNSIGMTMRVFKAPTVMTIPDVVRNENGERTGFVWHRQVIPYSFAISTEQIDREDLNRLMASARINSDETPRTESPNLVKNSIGSSLFLDALKLADSLNTDQHGTGDNARSIEFPDDKSIKIDLRVKGYRLPTKEEWHAMYRCGLEFEAFHGTYDTPFLDKYGKEEANGICIPNSAGCMDFRKKTWDYTISQFRPEHIGKFQAESEMVRVVRIRQAVVNCGSPFTLNNRTVSTESVAMPSSPSKQTSQFVRLAATLEL